MQTNGLNPDATERACDKFFSKNANCATCRFSFETLFALNCSNPEGESGPFVVRPVDTCECHQFASLRLDIEGKRLLDDWYHSIDWDEVAAAM